MGLCYCGNQFVLWVLSLESDLRQELVECLCTILLLDLRRKEQVEQSAHSSGHREEVMRRRGRQTATPFESGQQAGTWRQASYMAKVGQFQRKSKVLEKT